MTTIVLLVTVTLPTRAVAVMLAVPSGSRAPLLAGHWFVIRSGLLHGKHVMKLASHCPAQIRPVLETVIAELLE